MNHLSKRGDAYLRTLLIHGARSVIRVAERKVEDAQDWLMQIIGRRHKNIAAVALANKNARIVWALLAQRGKVRLSLKAKSGQELDGSEIQKCLDHTEKKLDSSS